MVNIIFVVLLINIVIYLFYRVFETVWPTDYFSEEDKVGLVISRTPRRFVVFRLAPVFMITFALLRIFRVSEFGINTGLIGVLCTLIHLSITNFSALFNLFRNSNSVEHYVNKINQILYHAITIITITITGYVSGLVSSLNYFDNFLPTREGFVDNIWSSFIYSIFFVGIYKYVMSKRGKSLEDILQESIQSIRKNNEVLEAIVSESIKNNSNRHIVEAICAVENIQRPIWFRKIEYLLPNASYGIMQTKSQKKLSDVDSIKKSVEKYLKNTNNITTFNLLEETILKYNNNAKYLQLVEQALAQIDNEYFYSLTRN